MAYRRRRVPAVRGAYADRRLQLPHAGIGAEKPGTAAVSIAFGSIAAFAGIGGATLFTPYFKATGMEPQLAIGTSAAIGLPVNLAGAHWLQAGRVAAWTRAAGQSATSMCRPPIALVLGTPPTVCLGVAVAHRLPSRAWGMSCRSCLSLKAG